MVESCPNTWNGLCFKLVNQHLPWAEAEQHCIDNYNGHLAEIHNTSQHDHVQGIVVSTTDEVVWIGASEALQNGVFAWASDGSQVTYNLFTPPDPNNWEASEACALVWMVTEAHAPNRAIFDARCEVPFQFLCQWWF